MDDIQAGNHRGLRRSEERRAAKNFINSVHFFVTATPVNNEPIERIFNFLKKISGHSCAAMRNKLVKDRAKLE